jgi:hypothetical protein
MLRNERQELQLDEEIPVTLEWSGSRSNKCERVQPNSSALCRN